MTVKSKAGVHWKDVYFEVHEVEDRFPTGPAIAYVKLQRPSNWKYSWKDEATKTEVRLRASRISGNKGPINSPGFYHVSTVAKSNLRAKRKHHIRRLALLGAVLS